MTSQTAQQSGTWEEVPVLASAPGPAGPGESWQEVDGFGLGLLVLWLLRHRAVSVPITEPRLVRVTCTKADGSVEVSAQALTPKEQAEMDEDVNEFLSEAGIPPRPGTRDWFLRVPADELRVVQDLIAERGDLF